MIKPVNGVWAYQDSCLIIKQKNYYGEIGQRKLQANDQIIDGILSVTLSVAYTQGQGAHRIMIKLWWCGLEAFKNGLL